MITVILVIHLIITIALIGVILLQRSEGGALGIGGSSPAALFSARGAANALTRATAILAAAFFMTSLLLTILSVRSQQPGSVFDQVAPQQGAPANGTVLPQLPAGGGGKTPAAPAQPPAPAGPQVPVEQ
jgi:preprotein translocase subunit SecG